ncbi:MAG: FHA domain-containing protein [Bdellovibrionales bacterium]|nr:FHA domain-containing protein [Bdellovibrionales bacterium]
MLLIKILTGPQSGQVIPIKEGVMTIGRSQECDVALMSNGVSKNHAQIASNGEKVIVKDLDSRNGTFVNGVQVRKKLLQAGDKLAFHDVYIEICDPQNLTTARQYVHPGPGMQAFPQPQGHPMYQQQQMAQFHGNAALNAQAMPDQMNPDEDNEEDEDFEPETIQERIQEYLDDVVLPGIYKLPQMLEFKWVLGIFMGAFIILVTSLSTIPLLRILKASVERESQEHALTIAKTLAKINAAPLSQGLTTNISVAFALDRAGVTKAFVISTVDGGAIIAPPSKAGSYPDIQYIHEGRLMGRESVKQVDSDTVVAMAPMEFYNPETGSRAITAYSVVVFDMGSLAIDDGKTLSLFIQTLFIALIVGSILFFFLYKMIHYPIASINRQLNDALKNETSQIEVDYEFDVLKELGNNISSALSRTGSSGGDGGGALTFEADRFQEMSNVVQLIGFGAIAINASDRTVTAVNEAFEEATRIHANDLMSQPVGTITDQALKANLEDLIGRNEMAPDQIATDQIDFGGDDYQIALSSVQGSQGIAYFVCVLFPAGAEEAE